MKIDKHSKMSPRERILTALAGGETDTPPMLNPTSVVTIESMAELDTYFPEAHIRAEKIAALASCGHDILGFDCVSPYFSVQLEAAALGCRVDWGTPELRPAILESSMDASMVDDYKLPKNFLDSQPIKEYLFAIKLLRKKYGTQMAIVGKVMGPWTLSYHLLGVQNVIMDSILQPDRIHHLLQKLLKVSLSFAEAQADAGIDVLTWADHATWDLVSTKKYISFLQPLHCEAALKLSGLPIILHTCGLLLDRLASFAETGFTGVHIDSRNDPATCIEITKGKIIPIGGINNPDTLAHGSPEEVATQVCALRKAGYRFISPECAVPLRVRNENLKVLVREAVGS
jgi:MtaA/CmuA family methyltransferase